MPKCILSNARVKSLRPRASAYDIRDAKLRGFGVRILPSGAGRFFIQIQHRGRRVWKIVGDANAINVDEARARAASLLAVIRCAGLRRAEVARARAGRGDHRKLRPAHRRRAARPCHLATPGAAGAARR